MTDKELTQIETGFKNLSPLVQAAMSGQLDTEKMSQLLDIQKQYEANEAKKAFHQALANFKSNELVIGKDRLVSHNTKAGGTKEYKYTSLGGAMAIIGPLLSEQGLNLTWNTTQDLEHGGMITVTAILSHAMGHSESTSLTASPEDSGGKNNPQAIGSTVTYLERYTGFAIIGITSMDADNDAGGKKEVEYITAKQAKEISDYVVEKDIAPAFLKWLAGPPIKANSIAEIQVKSLDIVRKQIAAVVRAKTKKGQQSVPTCSVPKGQQYED